MKRTRRPYTQEGNPEALIGGLTFWNTFYNHAFVEKVQREQHAAKARSREGVGDSGAGRFDY